MPTMKHLLGGISRQILVHSGNVKVLKSPSEFRDTLLALSSQVRKRVRLSSLYVGVGKPERAIISNIASAVTQYGCDVSVVIDKYRGTRDGGAGLKELRDKGAVYLYKAPHLNMLRYLPRPLGELLGVHHIKYYTFDDNVLLSGANLSSLYFGPRQDRYFLVKSQQLSDYLSYIHGMYVENGVEWLPMTQGSDINTKLHWTSERLKLSQTSSERFTCNTPIDTSTRDMGPANGDTSIYPLFQLGWHSIRQIDDVVDIILHTSKQDITISSGYFNPSRRFIQSVRNSKANITIVVPSYKANGFYNGGSLKGYVPDLYNISAIRTLKQCPNVNIVEYGRDEWSYHCKGVWHENMTIIGSSNFSKRSSNRDSEFAAAIVTENSTLADALLEEKFRILFHTQPLKKQYHFVASLGFKIISPFL